MQKKNQSAMTKIIILIVLFAAFVAFLIFSGRQQTTASETSEQTTSIETDVIETKMPEKYPSVETTTAAEDGEAQEETRRNLLKQETRTISYEELETEAPEETMTTASVIADGIIKTGRMEIDVSAVEGDLRQGELYSLADTITRYLAEKEENNVSGEVIILFCNTKETKGNKTQTVTFKWRKEKYIAMRDLTDKTSEYVISETPPAYE